MRLDEVKEIDEVKDIAYFKKWGYFNMVATFFKDRQVEMINKNMEYFQEVV